MHLFFSMACLLNLILAAYALALGNLGRSLVFAAISALCAWIIRQMTPRTNVDVHHHTEYHHHHHDPVHIHHRDPGVQA